MIIGILTHHFASNFGANIQTLSTVGYLQEHGHTPIVINWKNSTMERDFSSSVSSDQNNEHRQFLEKYLPITEECRTDEEIATAICKHNIQAVIVGSDAVVQHHPWITRFAFPTRSIISIRKYTSDRLFPNFFWGSFASVIGNKIPFAFMSVSCQNSPYNMFSPSTIRGMREACKKFTYISVRDSWTKRMFCKINSSYNNIEITPDPVFAFNQNADKYIPTREDIISKYGLSKKYMLISFFGNSDVDNSWIASLTKEMEMCGYQPVSLPFPSGACHVEGVKEIDLPLSPIDWYALIKYSNGFVGRNMHPIVVSLHNSVPFYSLDQYGTRTLNIFVNKKSSKIFDILERAGFQNNRITLAGIQKQLPSPKSVLNSLITFDKEKCKRFSELQTQRYNSMMESILNSFSL